MHVLIINEQWLTKILNGIKTWELRGSRTSRRGEIGLIQKGSGKIFGTCKITDVVGPLMKQELANNFNKHQIPENKLGDIITRYKKTYAWVLSEVRRLQEPISYQHPRGAVVWVRVGGNFSVM